MNQFTIIYRRADHADASSVVIDAPDIDFAARKAVALCDDDEYVVAVLQADTPADLIAWHAKTQAEHYELAIADAFTPPDPFSRKV